VEGLLFDEITTPAATQATATGTSFDSMNQMMALFMVLIGLLALYSAIMGKGPAYKNDYPKAMQEDANKLMRMFCWVIGPTAAISGVLEYMGHEWAYWAGLCIIGPAIVVYMVIFRRKFKKYLKK
jgi:hypothetical protein